MVVDAPGGDEGRLVVLDEVLGLGLLGRGEPDLEVFELAEAIGVARAGGEERGHDSGD